MFIHLLLRRHVQLSSRQDIARRGVSQPSISSYKAFGTFGTVVGLDIRMSIAMGLEVGRILEGLSAIRTLKGLVHHIMGGLDVTVEGGSPSERLVAKTTLVPFVVIIMNDHVIFQILNSFQLFGTYLAHNLWSNKWGDKLDE